MGDCPYAYFRQIRQEDNACSARPECEGRELYIMKNDAAATVRNRILKGAALCGVLALSMTLTGCFVPPDDLSGDLSNQGVVNNTVAVTAPPRTATPTPSPTPTVESVFNFGTNTIMPTTQPGVITSNGIVTVVATPPGSVATTARPTATPTPTAAAVLEKRLVRR